MELKIKSFLDNGLGKNYLSNDYQKYLKPCALKPDIMYRL